MAAQTTVVLVDPGQGGGVGQAHMHRHFI